MMLDALLTMSYGVYVIGSRLGDKLNGQISNTAMQVTSEPPQVSIAVNKQALTHACIETSRAFTITILSEEATLDFIGRFGFKSGRDTDKFAGIPMAVAASGSPYPTSFALAVLDAEVIKAEDMGTHTVFTGRLIDGRILGVGRPMTYSYYREILRGKTPPTAPTYQNIDKAPTPKIRDDSAGRYRCETCGYVYDPRLGDPEHGINPGTPFDRLPNDWRCPVCGTGKCDFSPE